MEFNFPFASLKQLSIISICQHWSDNNLGLFSEIRKESTVNAKVYDLFEKYSYMVKQLSIPAELKPAVCEVLYGICLQIHDWAQDISIFSSVEKFYFDSFGRFDIDRTVEHLYKNQVAATRDWSSLRKLFTEAVENAWLSEMDVVLRKMFTVEIQPMDVPLEGPSYGLLSEGQGFLMRYTFLQNLDTQNFRTRIRLLRLICLASEDVSIDVNDEGLVLKSKPICWSMKLLEKMYSFHKLLEKAFMDQFVIDSFPQEFIPTSQLLQGLTFIERASKRRWFSYVSENCKESMRLFLERLLVWPYTMHFVPAFKLMYPHLGRNTCVRLFYEILKMMFAQRWCGMLHDDLFMDFWSVLSVSMKIWCAAIYMGKTGPLFLFRMRKVGSGKRAILIHNAIMAELNALPKECPRLLRKRKHE